MCGRLITAFTIPDEPRERELLIELSDVCLTQGAFRLDDIELSVPSGQYGVLMGRTGCGKTSLLEAIAGLRPIRSGTIRLGGADVTRDPPASRQVGYVPQDGALFRTMTVGDQLGFALRVRGASDSDIGSRVGELADWLGIAHLLTRKPVGLSGGEAQRVALGRALSFRPKVLLLDEPFSALDDETRDGLSAVLIALRDSRELTVLHITHHRREALALGDRIWRLEGGVMTAETIRIRVEYFGPLRDAAGVSHETVELADRPTPASLLHHLADARPGRFAALVRDASGGIARSLMLARDDTQIEIVGGPLLRDGDRLTILVAISGGGS